MEKVFSNQVASSLWGPTLSQSDKKEMIQFMVRAHLDYFRDQLKEKAVYQQEPRYLLWKEYGKELEWFSYFEEMLE